MKLELKWSYFDPNSQQNFKSDMLDVSEDEAKTILKEAICFWDREESFPSGGCEFPELVKRHVNVFGFDSTNPADYQQHSNNYLNELGFPTLYDIMLGSISVATDAEEKKEKISDEYWEKEDADGFDEPQLIDDDELEKYINELFEQAKQLG